MRNCIKCGRLLTDENSLPNGRICSICLLKCDNERGRKWREKNKEYKNMKDAEYRKNHPDIIKRAKDAWYINNRDYALALSKERRKDPAVKEARRLQSAKYSKTHREKKNAGIRVWRAIKSGQIKRLPCQYPNCSHIYKQAEAHHKDYGKPYEVVFLCPRHHALADKIKISADKTLKLIDEKK